MPSWLPVKAVVLSLDTAMAVMGFMWPWKTQVRNIASCKPQQVLVTEWCKIIAGVKHATRNRVCFRPDLDDPLMTPWWRLQRGQCEVQVKLTLMTLIQWQAAMGSMWWASQTDHDKAVMVSMWWASQSDHEKAAMGSTWGAGLTDPDIKWKVAMGSKSNQPIQVKPTMMTPATATCCHGVSMCTDLDDTDRLLWGQHEA